MSIRNTQINNVLVDIVRILYSTGVKPPLNNVLEMVSDYFGRYPAGSPLPMPVESLDINARADVSVMNEIMSALDVNLDLLYDVSQEQIDEVMGLTTQLKSYIGHLQSVRRRIETQVDDYMLSLYNSDGYYYSISDVFSDLGLVDLSLTSAYVDTQQGYVQLPVLSSLSQRIAPGRIAEPQIQIMSGGSPVTFRTIAPWGGATDGLTNTVWSIEAETSTPQELVATITINFEEPGAEISRIDIDPYGISEAQYYVNMEGAEGFSDDIFGNKILTTINRFSLVDAPQPFMRCIITIRKTIHDYIEMVDGAIKYRYVFGLKDLIFTEQTYDNDARVVSKPLRIPQELEGQYVIDAVSVTVDAETPPDTSITYYIAEDVGGVEIGDFSWRRIDPVETVGAGGVRTLRFNGARNITRNIVPNPGSEELQLIPIDLANTDLKKRNPSPIVIPGVNMWRISKFEDESVLLNSVQLEEGVNTVRFYHTDYAPEAVNDLSWWATRIPNLTANYNRIDVGNEFFYGGAIGESNRSVYMETFVNIDSEVEPVHAEFRKTDNNSQAWAVRVYLNGRDVGFLPVGVHRALIPYTFQEGLNHIAIVALIPAPTTAVPNPYIGTLDLMSTSELFDYGTVKLGTWSYVDLFDMKYNRDASSYAFTIVDGEIVSRRQPTANFRVSYASDTAQGPQALRFRADLARGVDNKNVTPSLSQYRLRFSYSE